MKRFFTLNFCLLVVVLFGCDYAANTLQADRSGNMETQDYRDALAPREPQIADLNAGAGTPAASIPQLHPYMSGTPANIASMPLVSISVNQTVPLRDALYELAQQADYDITLDPRISGAIIYSARNKPLDQVVESISKIAGLRYKFEGESLRIELDTPFNKSYKVDYLTLVRTSSSSINTDVSVVSGEGADAGSSFQTSYTNELDFWSELETALSQILASANNNILRTTTSPEVQVTPINPNVQPVAGVNGVAPPDVNLNIGSLPSGGGESYSAPSLSFSINRQAGIVQVFAPDSVHEDVAQYFKLLKKSVTSQVLIEAKVLEITLSDQFASGVDWDVFRAFNDKLQLSVGSAIDLSATNISDAGFSLGYFSGDVSSIVTAASQFGTVKALASPRLTVLNNQTGVLNVATNEVFFDLDVTIDEGTEADPGGRTQVDGDIVTIPIGVLINVQPSIDTVNNTVDLALRPTITAIADFVNNPITQIATANSDNPVLTQVPEINVQEIDTVVSMRSGQAIIMGGLLQDRVIVDDNGVPILKDIPYAGNLFKRKSDTIEKTELIIFLKATILEQPSDSIHNTDRDLYRRFSDDRRPFSL